MEVGSQLHLSARVLDVANGETTEPVAVEGDPLDAHLMVNELAQIFKCLDIDTEEVLEAAGTKWNFIPMRPGLVGGHCIGVDPYYLTAKAEALASGQVSELITIHRNTDAAGQLSDIRDLIAADVDAIMGGNWLRFYDEAFGPA